MYRLSVWSDNKKDVIAEEESIDEMDSEIRAALDDLEKDVIRSVVISRIIGRTGIRDDL